MSYTNLLNEILLKSVYRSNNDSLLEDFYIPCLHASSSYDRAVGYFSSSLFYEALKGLSGFVYNNGKMRLIIGHPLSSDEFNIVKESEDFGEVESFLENKYEEIVNSLDTKSSIHRLEVFKFLILNGQLEIKFALRRTGMYHEKIGRFSDDAGNEVVFQGSANETEFANASSKNFESIMVFANWKAPEEIFNEYTKPFTYGFQRLWDNEEDDTITFDVSSSLYEKITKNAKKTPSEFSLDEELKLEIFERNQKRAGPNIPKLLNDIPFELKKHQLEAIENWKKIGSEQNGIRGILKLATGAGKTITSISCAVRLYNMLKTKGQKFSLVVAVPYDNLAEQWVDILRVFGFDPIKCYRSSSKWKSELNKAQQQLITEAIDNVCLVVINKTLRKEVFQEYISKIDKITYQFFIGDECHHHSSLGLAKALPNSSFRMGLSATPYYEEDSLIEYSDERKQILSNYYGEVVSTYDLGDALRDDVLTPYKYFIHPVFLNENESEEYINLSKEIGHKFAMGESLDSEQSNLSSLLSARSRLLANLDNKLDALKIAMSKIPKDDKCHSLVYCGDGYVDIDNQENRRQVDVVSSLVNKLGWTNQKFTSTEGKLARHQIMKSFKDGAIDALIAIKVLDEGIDVPVCKRAFILASSKNPRQYIQRRGRILRKSPGKLSADIHDFLIIPSQDIMDAGYGKSLLKSEFSRVVESNTLALNSAEINIYIRELLSEHNINLDELECLI
ncbi:DEAD/DEAH box helicase family protein [Vibrio sp. Vb339]|uniref:DEAD/DEAH box helicase family protein n=1 Tax=Vibrio sp. Vb339 TaxID=1192013 RepID=UPI0015536363|nr:DEAD/DEAH box helicase family protein [Vibrio sp. Vb339]